jgi:hypothetical protein
MNQYIKIYINKNYFSSLAETLRNEVVGFIILTRTRTGNTKNRGSTPAQVRNLSSSLDYPVRVCGNLNSYSNRTGDSPWV